MRIPKRCLSAPLATRIPTNPNIVLRESRIGWTQALPVGGSPMISAQMNITIVGRTAAVKKQTKKLPSTHLTLSDSTSSPYRKPPSTIPTFLEIPVVQRSKLRNTRGQPF